jgi:YidC/Oxa1 family membrane protein insertase
MKRILQAALFLLCMGSIPSLAQVNDGSSKGVQDAAPSESFTVEGTVEVKNTELRPNVVVREETITVRVPLDAPLVEYVFTDLGGTLRHARLLDPKFTREELPPSFDWVPAEILEGGKIDIVSTWHPSFLPYRLKFTKFELGKKIGNRLDFSEAHTDITRVVRFSKSGSINSDKITIDDSITGKWDVNRVVEPGDSVEILNVAAFKGVTFKVERLVGEGKIVLDRPVEGAPATFTYKVFRRGLFRDIFQSDPAYTRVSTDAAGLPVTYVWPDPRYDTSPIFVEKRYYAADGKYQLRLETEIHNFSEHQAQYLTRIHVSAWQHPDQAGGSTFTPPSNLLAASCFTGGSLEREEFPSLSELFAEDGETFACQFDTEWIGVDTVYFLNAIAPNKSLNRRAELRANPNGVIVAELLHPETTLKAGDQSCIPSWLTASSYSARMTCSDAYETLNSKPGDTAELRYLKKRADEEAGNDSKALAKVERAYNGLKSKRISREPVSYVIYTGPKDVDILETAGHDLFASMDYGFLAFVAEPIHQLMRWFHSVVGHWGLAIILLTLLIKLCLLPLTQKSFMAMQKMQKLKPDLDALKKTHGEDKQAFNKAMFALYKKHNVNPLGGCLPMVLQMPIWIALYRTIAGAVELYHTPLGLWIDDLSASDPYFIMPVCMGALMVVQNAISGSTASMDGMQAKLMKWGMPIMFTTFMMFLPSGLVLYILVNTVLTIFQNLYIRRGLAT